jgi:hypothetical protein
MTYRGNRSCFLIKYINLIFLVLMIYLSGCATWMGFPAYFDPTTYKNLTDLKPEIMMLYDTFTKETPDEKKIEKIHLKLAQIYEYEKGKGDKNRETYTQIKMIAGMFENHIDDRIENGTWSKTHLENQKENIGEAFDIAIRTESQKNKND